MSLKQLLKEYADTLKVPVNAVDATTFTKWIDENYFFAVSKKPGTGKK